MKVGFRVQRLVAGRDGMTAFEWVWALQSGASKRADADGASFDFDDTTHNPGRKEGKT